MLRTPRTPSREYERETTHARSTRNAKLEKLQHQSNFNVFYLSNSYSAWLYTHTSIFPPFPTVILFPPPCTRFSLPPNRIFQPKKLRFPKTLLHDRSILLYSPYTSCVLKKKKKKKNCTKREGRNESFDKTNAYNPSRSRKVAKAHPPSETIPGTSYHCHCANRRREADWLSPGKPHVVLPRICPRVTEHTHTRVSLQHSPPAHPLRHWRVHPSAYVRGWEKEGRGEGEKEKEEEGTRFYIHASNTARYGYDRC